MSPASGAGALTDLLIVSAGSTTVTTGSLAGVLSEIVAVEPVFGLRYCSVAVLPRVTADWFAAMSRTVPVRRMTKLLLVLSLSSGSAVSPKLSVRFPAPVKGEPSVGTLPKPPLKSCASSGDAAAVVRICSASMRSPAGTASMIVSVRVRPSGSVTRMS